MQVFPSSLKGLNWPVKRSPLWNTIPQDSISGRSVRFSLWSYPKYKYTIGYDVLRSDVNTDWQTLVGFFNLANGSAQVWQFQDLLDYQVTNQGFGSGDGSTTQFQLVRTLGGFSEPVTCPLTHNIYVAGTLQSPSSYTVSNTGVVTFNVAPAAAAALTWTGTYNWYCMFDKDQVDFEEFYSNFWTLKQIEFTTAKF